MQLDLFEDVKTNEMNSNIFEEFCERQLLLEQEIEELEKVLKDKKKKLLKFQTTDFVDLMMSYGMRNVHLNKYDINISSKLYVNESGANKEKICEFLRQYNAIDLIENNVTLRDVSIHDIQMFIKLGFNVNQSTQFNVASVKAFISDLRKKGECIDLNNLGIYEETKTIVKRSKQD